MDKQLKKYEKPAINKFGDLKDLTQGGEEGKGDKLGRYGEVS